MVISIIAILVSILVPALVSVLQQSYATATAAELNSVRAACESYYATFDAYPGLFSEADIALQDVKDANGNVITGTQNMLLSLMGPAYYGGIAGAIAAPPNDTGYVTVKDSNGNAWFYVPYLGDTANAGYAPISFGSGPIDYSNGGVQKTAFFSPPADELQTEPPNTANALPTLFDAFPHGVPILYYRKNPGMPGTNGVPVEVNSTTSSPAGETAGFAAFYLNCNAAYTSPANSTTYLTTKGGKQVSEYYSAYNDSATAPAIAGPPAAYGSAINDLAATVVNQSLASYNTPTSGSYYNQIGNPVRGGFVLISAGPDHIYGTNLNPSIGLQPQSDDIVVFGGQ